MEDQQDCDPELSSETKIMGVFAFERFGTTGRSSRNEKVKF